MGGKTPLIRPAAMVDLCDGGQIPFTYFHIVSISLPNFCAAVAEARSVFAVTAFPFLVLLLDLCYKKYHLLHYLFPYAVSL